MKGLLIKDFLSTKYILLSVIGFFVFFTAVLFPSEFYLIEPLSETEVADAVLTTSLVCATISFIALFSQDSFKWNFFLLTTPISRTVTALSKYVFALIVIMIFSLVLLPSISSICISYYIRTSLVAELTLTFILLAIIIVSITFPAIFLFSKPETHLYTRSLYLHASVYFCLWIFNDYSRVMEYITSNLFTTVPLIAITMFTVSILFSIRVMRKKYL